MFDIGFGEFVLIVVAALFVFGPDRLPGMAAQAARALRQVRGMAAGVRKEITDVVGPELGELDLTDLNPRRAVTRTLLDADRDADRETGRDVDGATRRDADREAAPPPAFDPDAT